jgi:hypothetical protein
MSPHDHTSPGRGWHAACNERGLIGGLFGLLFGTSFEAAVSKPIARFCGVASSEARMRFGVSCDTFRNGEIPS